MKITTKISFENFQKHVSFTAIYVTYLEKPTADIYITKLWYSGVTKASYGIELHKMTIHSSYLLKNVHTNYFFELITWLHKTLNFISSY